MKRIKQWFDELPQGDFKNKLQNNLISEFADREVDSLNKAIFNGFYWTSTPEGFAYWDKVTGNSFT